MRDKQGMGAEMLQGLDAVPWNALTHAYGPADDVPYCLRGIASPEADRREGAWSALYGNIWHQGTVYEATAHAVPFLIELAADASVLERERVLVYLGHLATGSSYLDAHQHLSIFEEQRNAPDFAAKLAEEMSWVRAAREAVRTGAATYAGLLDAGEHRVRAAAAYLIGRFHEDEDLNGRWVIAHADREGDVMVHAACVLAAGMLGPRHAAWLQQKLDDKDEVVRLAGALGLAWAQPADVPEAARAILQQTVVAPSESVQGVFAAFPWHDADASDYCSDALSTLDGAAPLDALLEAFEATTYAKSGNLGSAILRKVFVEPIAAGATFAALSGDQQRVVRAIADCDNFWRPDVNVRAAMEAAGFEMTDDERELTEASWANRWEVLHPAGLPPTRDELRDFIAGSPAGSPAEGGD